ncbi:chitooligosaccharidolytic beta-N-acetylglucosaminidase-like isoform X1 [Homarus americanus]|uniref:chitooligosaccharidolytic beta-N-acetylglucosaminidase-like isoform X1 n=1 Tax=Homarus americanus TaxID=6706 RepID=UPI001C4775F6|nr:chitooligosaccharidolytic beta-N-acetylglucosaminidase-like isoform X1 [Homarus americanus]
MWRLSSVPSEHANDNTMFPGGMLRLRWVMLLPCLLLVSVPFSATFRVASPWGWRCVNETCVKEENDGLQTLPHLSTCKLTCARDGVLWPRPTGILQLGDQTVHFLLESLTLQGVTAPNDEIKQLIKKAFHIFKDHVAKNLPEEGGRPLLMGPFRKKTRIHRVMVEVTVTERATRLSLETSEAYTLGVTTLGPHTNATILASNFFGARHALETLSQLIEYDEATGALQILSTAAISDSPVFKYRGILLDTSRNFFPVKAIERTLDTMAANKLNTFHWHITDTQTFPLYLESLPNMAYYGAYSSRKVYYPADIRHLVEYGRVRGVRVLPEFDAPAHVGNGWQWTKKYGLGELVLCLDKQPWKLYCWGRPCGQLNIVNNNTYLVLGQIYKEMVDLFSPLDMFHFGGDEVKINCWNTTEEFVAYMEENGLSRDLQTFHDMWADFQRKALKLLTSANGGKNIPGIVWTSSLTDENILKYLDPQQYIIQVWTTADDPTIGNLLNKGYRIILSNYDSLYLDCGNADTYRSGESWCGPYNPWQTVYDNSPDKIATHFTGSPQRNLVLGAEAPLWSESVDVGSLDAKLWPRGSALAERLWTNPLTNWESAEIRLIHHRQRMVTRGVRADRIQPQWCHQNEGLCYLK